MRRRLIRKRGELSAGKWPCVLLSVFLMTCMAPLLAGDGQTDILPNGKVTFTISKPGSYVLTDNVTMTANIDCIKITANNVSLDLNGHTITGMGSDSGTARGIMASACTGICIRNGTILSFGGDGIITGANARIMDVILEDNGGEGIKALDCCTIAGNTCYRNSNACPDTGGRAFGIDADDGCTIINNNCSDNNATNLGAYAFGIRAGDGCTIIGNTCHDNTGLGESADAYGIFAKGNCMIAQNTCSENKGQGDKGDGHGIYIDGGRCVVRDNNCSENTGKSKVYGIKVRAGKTRVEGNSCRNHDPGLGIDIYSTLSGCLVIRNDTEGNADGISMGNASHYCAENMCTDGIINTTGVKMGEGDRSNISF